MTNDTRDDDPILRLTEQVESYSRQAEDVAAMLTGHRTLECPACGLIEDALADLTLRVVHPDHPEDDTGLRFESISEDGLAWRCPGCGELFDASHETP